MYKTDVHFYKLASHWQGPETLKALSDPKSLSDLKHADLYSTKPLNHKVLHPLTQSSIT